MKMTNALIFCWLFLEYSQPAMPGLEYQTCALYVIQFLICLKTHFKLFTLQILAALAVELS